MVHVALPTTSFRLLSGTRRNPTQRLKFLEDPHPRRERDPRRDQRDGRSSLPVTLFLARRWTKEMGDLLTLKQSRSVTRSVTPTSALVPCTRGLENKDGKTRPSLRDLLVGVSMMSRPGDQEDQTYEGILHQVLRPRTLCSTDSVSDLFWDGDV